MRCFLLIVWLAGLDPLAAQLKINQDPPYEAGSVYKLPGVEPVTKAEEEPEEPKRPIYEGDPVVVRAACRNEILLDAGLSCTAASPCNLELELLLAEKIGERLLVAGSIRSGAGTVESVLLVSADGGGAWSEAADRVSAGGFEVAQFLDGEVGWVGGQRSVDGAVSQPILFFTRDGGEDFVERPVRAGEEPEEGSIVELQFDSADHGYLILEKANAAIDPFTLYETYNGGRSWSIRQIVAERPAIPGARRRPRVALDSNYRLSTRDGVIELEERSGAGWARLAGFQIEIGSCPAPE